MKINQYISNLKRGAGHDRAIKIAHSRMMATNPNNFNDLPKGDIFLNEDRKKQGGFSQKELKKLHGWWTQVYYTLKKGMEQ